MDEAAEETEQIEDLKTGEIQGQMVESETSSDLGREEIAAQEAGNNEYGSDSIQIEITSSQDRDQARSSK